MQFFLSITFWLVLGAYISHQAEKRGRDPKHWFFIGVLFGLPALIVLLLLKPATKPADELLLLEVPPELAPEPPAPQPTWFFLNAQNQPEGPVLLDALREAWQATGSQMEFFVWCEGMPEWKPVSRLPYLIELLRSPTS